MSYASQTLRDIIDRSFEARQLTLARAAGIPGSNINRLIQGNMALTPASLEKLTRAMLPDDARALCLAAARDVLPPEFADHIQIADAMVLQEPAPNYGPKLDARSEAIFRILRRLIASEPGGETRAWLHRIGSWISAGDCLDSESAAAVLDAADSAGTTGTGHQLPSAPAAQ